MGEGDLKVTATGDSSGFDQMLNRMKVHGKQAASEISSGISASWAGIGKGMIGGIIGALSFGAVKSFIGSTFEQSKSIRDTAEAFDLSTDSVQVWEKSLRKAGISASVFYRSLDTLRQKRQEAREDHKKLIPFTNLGLSSEALDAGMSDEELLRRILASNASRSSVNQVLGRRGATLRGAIPKPGSMPALSAEDIAGAEAAEAAWQTAKVKVKAFFGKRIAFIFNPDNWKDAWNYAGRPEAWKKEVERRRKERSDKAAAEAKEDAEDARRSQAYDEMQKNASDEADNQIKMIDANKQLERAKQQNMTVSQRHSSILKELAATREEIAAYEGVGVELGPDQKLRLLKLKAEEQGLIHDAREHPTPFIADSMAKIGAYSESALFGNPLVSISQQQLRALNSIDRRLAMTKSPFQHP